MVRLLVVLTRDPTSQEALAREKRALRARLLATARAPYPQAARVAQARVLELAAAPGTRTLALYAAQGAEMPTAELFARLIESGREVALPRVAGTEIELRAVRSLTELAPGYRGILEPGSSAPSVEIDRVDVFVVPGLCFDRAGHRLGRGGGHYDRLLARARSDALRIGLCPAARVVARVPAGPGDATMDFVVTELETIDVCGGLR